MKLVIKKYLKKTLVFKYLKSIKENFRKYKRTNNSKINKIFYLIRLFLTFRIYKYEDLGKLLKSVKINVNNESNFIYNIDTNKKLFSDKRIIGNITINYDRLLKCSLEDLKNENNCEVIKAIEELIDRTVKELEKSKNENKEDIINNLTYIKTRKVSSFKEALQRILFYNQLLWQTGHRLNGLGRLDKILYPYYENDIKNNKITDDEAEKLLVDFCNILHNYYWFKSNVLMGDTGQIIILGGLEKDGEYFCNRLTYMFIEIMEKLKLPDPKVLLRVANNMPRDLMELSLKCIQTGIGCPLFSNDDVVIPLLIKYGYDIEDAYNYVTAACWEPIIPEKTFDQTNITTINFLKPFHKMLDSEDLLKINNVDILLDKYEKYIKEYCKEIFAMVDQIKWQKDPLLSFMTEGCQDIDISLGSAKYNHYGVNSVGLASTVNSIMNIKELVFDKKEYNLEQLNQLRKDNFKDAEIDFIKKLKMQSKKYGIDDDEVIEISNKITQMFNKEFMNYRNKFGGSIKFGLSSPGYITEAEKTEASLDGRKDKEPFAVHISSDNSRAYTELIQFAAKLNYSGNRFNGNVVDFIVSPEFIKNNFDKFVEFLIANIKVGFFQMQMNVVSSEMLIRAKEHPEEFPNLIVRVWGFSAYFNDLPEEYKNVIIERALKSESINN